MARGIQEPGTLANMITSTINSTPQQKQKVLELDSVKQRLREVTRLVNGQLEILELGQKIQSQVKGDMEKSQREYYLRQQLKAIREELGETDDGNLELGDTLEQDTVPSVEVEMIRTSFERRIQEMVGGLDEKERDVMRMRFGLDGEEPKTLQEIGETMGLSRERIRQIESRAKEKLRRSREAHGLRGYLN